jgi:hypothetical protein
MCATQIFRNFDQTRFDCVVQRAAGLGVVIDANEGQASKDGITIRWKFDPAGKTLEVQCLAAPFFLSCGQVNHRIHDEVDGCP